jgi:hypothetical protein
MALESQTELLQESSGAPQADPTPRKRRGVKRRVGTADGSTRVTRAVVVAEAPSYPAAELRKAPEAITVRNVSTSVGEISFLQRKAFNALLSFAQQNRRGEQITFEIAVSEFEDLVGHTTSNSREYLKNIARGLTDIKLEFDYKGDTRSKTAGWGVANMIAEVYLSPDEKRIKFSFPPELANNLLSPTIYNAIDIRMQNLFTSHSALTLFEIVSRYHGFKMRETFREHWTAWSILLSGGKEAHPEFRDFNKMLMRAIDQVNTHEQRFKVVPHVNKRGRKIDKLWFVLEPQDQSQLPLDGTPAIVGEELLKRLRDIGLTDAEVTQHAMMYEEEYLLAQADYLDKRMKKKNADPVGSPKAFFQSAVEGNYAEAPRHPAQRAESRAEPAPKPKALGKADATKKLNSLREEWKRAKMEAIRTSFASEIPDRRKAIVDSMLERLQKTPAIATSYRKNGISTMVEAAVVNLLFADQYPNEPGAEELLQFAFETGSLLPGAAAQS